MSISRRLLPRLRESKFRGNEISKLTSASLDHPATFRVIAQGPGYKPDELIKSLRELSAVSSPSLSALCVLAQRTADSSSLFFPPQITEALSLFAKVGFSSEAPSLFSFLTARKDDVLNEASPKRIVQLIEAISELNLPLFHPSLWPDLRESLVRIIPQLKRGVPTVLQALAKSGCTDTELVDSLLVQAECCWLQGEIETNFFANAIEAAASMSPDQARSCLSVLLDKRPVQKLSPTQSVNLLVAALRTVSNEGIVTDLRANIRRSLELTETFFDVARSLALIARKGLSLNAEEEVLANDFVEAKISDFAFAKFIPYTVRDLSLCSNNTEFTKAAISKLVSETTHIDRYSADKLLSVMRAAVLSGCGPEVVSKLIDPITRCARQLSLREARQLWEVVPGLLPVSTLPPLLPRGMESAPLRLETVGPYSLHKSEKGLQLLVPEYQVVRPGEPAVMRRDMELRLAAIQRDLIAQGNNSVVSIVTSFS